MPRNVYIDFRTLNFKDSTQCPNCSHPTFDHLRAGCTYDESYRDCDCPLTQLDIMTLWNSHLITALDTKINGLSLLVDTLRNLVLGEDRT